MADKKNTTRKRSFDYPSDTIGSRAAAEARARTNNLSEEEIEKLYEEAKRIAYGGGSKPKVGARH
jgi:hypothetical protein